MGIGLTEIAAPRWLTNQLGLDDRHEYRGILRVLGIREIMAGVGILTEDKPEERLAAGVWGRVAGDALDVALLGAASKKTQSPGGVAAAAAMVVGITILDVLCGQRLQQRQQPETLPARDRLRTERLPASERELEPLGV